MKIINFNMQKGDYLITLINKGLIYLRNLTRTKYDIKIGVIASRAILARRSNLQ